MTRFLTASGSLLALGSMLLAAPAQAQDTEGALQLGLMTPIFSYQSLGVTTELPSGDAETDVSGTSWGIRDEVTAEIGYGLTDALVLGGLVQLGGSSTTTEPEGSDESESSEFSLFLAPKLDFMFSPGQRLSPFIGAAAGLAMSSSEAGEIETSVTGFQVMGRVGLRAFLADGFSVDPALAFSWLTASGETDAGAASVDSSVSGITVGLLLGVSGWL